MKKKKKPMFNVPNAGSGKRGKVRVKDRWRKPKGIDNKKRIRKKSHGASPRVGYKNAAKIRGLHPSGHKEVLIRNAAELERTVELAKKEGKKVAIRIAHGVSVLKRIFIEKEAKKKGIKVLNPLHKPLSKNLGAEKEETKGKEMKEKESKETTKAKENKQEAKQEADKGGKA